MDILGRSPPFSIPFQSGVSEGDNLRNRLAPSVCLCPLRRGKRQQCLVICSISSSSAGRGPRVRCAERCVQIQSWESGGSAQEEERAQRSFLLWALFPFPRVHAWPWELSQASFSVCGSQITVSLELLLSTRPSPFDILQTSCQTSEGLTVIPPFHPAARVILTLTVHYARTAFLQIFLWSDPAQASKST